MTPLNLQNKKNIFQVRKVTVPLLEDENSYIRLNPFYQFYYLFVRSTKNLIFGYKLVRLPLKEINKFRRKKKIHQTNQNAII